MKRVRIYSRVSTKDKQETENQVRQLMEEIEKHPDWELTHVYLDKESGKKGRAGRPAFHEMLEDARARKFDMLLFWSQDRFTREGVNKTTQYFMLLNQCGVTFKSFTEPYLDTDNELVRYILIGVLAWVAKHETERLSLRTKAGLETARRKGKMLGRPSKFEMVKDRLEPMVALGMSDYKIAKQLKLKPDTVKTYRARLDQESSNQALFSEGLL
jgi:DNA invertase Pin-like site-specific DNA recombinase